MVDAIPVWELYRALVAADRNALDDVLSDDVSHPRSGEPATEGA